MVHTKAMLSIHDVEELKVIDTVLNGETEPILGPGAVEIVITVTNSSIFIFD